MNEPEGTQLLDMPRRERNLVLAFFALLGGVGAWILPGAVASAVGSKQSTP